MTKKTRIVLTIGGSLAFLLLALWLLIPNAWLM